MEKPFGTDLASRAVELNAALHEMFDERQIFRIDHFLGKEAALNILAFRFANGLFEPIWNRVHIDHVQIDVPETLAIGTRIGFYEQTGAYRDMVVTHLFQVLAFMAMEPPTELDAAARSPRRRTRSSGRCCRSTRTTWCGASTRATATRSGVAPHSETETFVALQVRDRQLAVGRRAVLPPHRQAHGRGRPHHLDRLPGAAEEHVPRGLGRGRPGPGPPDVRPRRRRRSCRCRSTASGPGRA